MEETKKALDKAIEEQAPLATINRLYVKYVLACKSNNKVHAAKQIGIDRRTIQRWNKSVPTSGT